MDLHARARMATRLSVALLFAAPVPAFAQLDLPRPTPSEVRPSPLGAPIPTPLTPNTPQVEIPPPAIPPQPAKAENSATSVLQKIDRKELEEIVELYMKKKEAEKKVADAAKKAADEDRKLIEQALKDEERRANDHGVQFLEHQLLPRAHEIDPERQGLIDELIDSLGRHKDGKKWYDRLSIRGYTQIRYGRTISEMDGSALPNLFGDRTINGQRENFLIRRARLILSGDVSEHLYIYIQPDFASNTDGAVNNTFFTQLRDLYADYYIDKDKVNRLRIGLSKIPYGWENCQSSQNRVPLDRTDAMNTAVAPNERDLGIIYYWTPVEKQKLLTQLVNGGFKGSNNFGIFAFGVYNGQGGAQVERNNDLHIVSRLTYPYQFANGQVVEAGIQGYRGEYVFTRAPISPLGRGALITPGVRNGEALSATSGRILEQRVAASFSILPQPFGFQAEWQYGEGPGLNNEQTIIDRRIIHGGYLMGMYRHETDKWGIITPYTRWQQFNGGYRNQTNAPYGYQRQLDFGIEWQLRKEFEVTLEWSRVTTPNFTTNGTANTRSYANFDGEVLRLQMQFNY